MNLFRNLAIVSSIRVITTIQIGIILSEGGSVEEEPTTILLILTITTAFFQETATEVPIEIPITTTKAVASVLGGEEITPETTAKT